MKKRILTERKISLNKETIATLNKEVKNNAPAERFSIAKSICNWCGTGK